MLINVFVTLFTILGTTFASMFDGGFLSLSKVFDMATYTPLIEWASVEVRVSSTTMLPQGIVAFALLMVLDRFATRLFVAMRRVYRLLRPRIMRGVARVRVAIANAIAFVQLYAEEAVRLTKLIPSKISKCWNEFKANTKKSWHNLIESAKDFGRFCILVAQGIAFVIRFIWMLLKSLFRTLKHGKTEFTRGYEVFRKSETTRKERRAKRNRAKELIAFSTSTNRSTEDKDINGTKNAKTADALNGKESDIA